MNKDYKQELNNLFEEFRSDKDLLLVDDPRTQNIRANFAEKEAQLLNKYQYIYEKSKNSKMPEQILPSGTTLDQLNIMPLELYLQIQSYGSATEFLDKNDQLFAEQCCNIASKILLEPQDENDSLEMHLLSLLIAVAVMQKEETDANCYIIYDIVTRFLNLNKKPEFLTGEYIADCFIHECSISLSAAFGYSTIFSYYTYANQLKENIIHTENYTKYYTEEEYWDALKTLETVLTRFKFAHVYLGRIDGKPSYINITYEQNYCKNNNPTYDHDALKNMLTQANLCVAGAVALTMLTEYKNKKQQWLKEAKQQNSNKKYQSCKTIFNNERYTFIPQTKLPSDEDPEHVNVTSPHAIKAYLDRHVLGQDQAKKFAAMLYYLHTQKHMSQSIILAGPSGCGKTEIFRWLSKLQKHKIIIYDISNISKEGFKGNKKFDSVFQNMTKANWQKKEIENAIIVFDEADKLFRPMYAGTGDNINLAIQYEMLAMIEGTTLELPERKEGGYDKNGDPWQITIGGLTKTHNVSFIFLGAFTELTQKKKVESYTKTIGFGSDNDIAENTNEHIEKVPIELDDLIEYGLCPELAGRIARVTLLDPLTENDMFTIVTDPIMSPVAKFVMDYGEAVSLSESYLKNLAKQAIEKPMGVRFMHGCITDILTEEIYSPGTSEDAKFLTSEEVNAMQSQ